MSLVTYNLTVTLREEDNTLVEGAVVSAKLDRPDEDGGMIVPDRQSATTNANGQAVLALWPNTRGTAGSRYVIRARHPDTGRRLLRVLVTMPEQDSTLTDILDYRSPRNPTYTELSQATAAADLAEKWAENPEDTAVEAGKYSALHHAAKAEGSATAAAASETAAQTAKTNAETAETNAAASASAASTSETNAAASASAASTSETNAAASASAAQTAETNAETAETNAETAETNAAASEAKAQQWAEETEDVEVEPGQFSAHHWANKAQAFATGNLSYEGSHDASTGAFPANPSLGDFWKISVAGIIDGRQHNVGDSIIYNGGTATAASGWDHIDNTEQVTSVAGKVGVVTLAASDIASGTFANARISQSSVTQHQAALSIAETQIANGSVLGRLAEANTWTGLNNFDQLKIKNSTTARYTDGLSRERDTTLDSGGAMAITPDTSAGFSVDAWAQTGAIKITLPYSWTSTMMNMVIKGFDYNQGTANWVLYVGGYNYSIGNYWDYENATLVGDAPFDKVRFGHDGTKCCIILGDVTDVWGYPKVWVDSFNPMYYNTTDDWVTGWDVSQITSTTGITFTGQVDNPGLVRRNGDTIEGNLVVNGILSGVTDPTAGTHVGDRDYNDSRYLRTSAAALGTQLNALTRDTSPASSSDYVLSYEASSGNARKIRLDDLPGGGGVTDHGALTGLGDDDHPQYALASGGRDFTGGITVSMINPQILLRDTDGTDSDFRLWVANSVFRIRDESGGDDVLTVDQSGNLSVDGNVSGNPSDGRLKTEFYSFDSGTLIDALVPGVFFFDPKACERAGFRAYDKHLHRGFDAREIRKVLGDAAAPLAGFDRGENGKSKSGHDYRAQQNEELIAVLWAEVRDLRKRIARGGL